MPNKNSENKIKIHSIRRSDAEQVGQMIRGMAQYLRGLGDNTDFRFNAKSFLRDGFGRNRAFYGFIVEADGTAAGYALYHGGYDTDKGYRVVYLADLYVRPEYRGMGLGRQLIEAVKNEAKKKEAKKIFWTVYAPNRAARQFYWHIGARYSTGMLAMKLPVK
jgi:GNAT superfamily N-acetyltransferase